ncbi:hypothetical protein HOY82DRAFT_1782 [Tuber indicum]|nr:hypothetical protein HOY82DRAFT_1782 [Tuber indicum]
MQLPLVVPAARWFTGTRVLNPIANLSVPPSHMQYSTTYRILIPNISYWGTRPTAISQHGLITTSRSRLGLQFFGGPSHKAALRTRSRAGRYNAVRKEGDIQSDIPCSRSINMPKPCRDFSRMLPLVRYLIRHWRLKKAPVSYIDTVWVFRESEKLELGSRKAPSFPARGHPKPYATLCRPARRRLWRCSLQGYCSNSLSQRQGLCEGMNSIY